MTQESVRNGDYNKGLPAILKALKKYPNDLELLENAARLLSAMAWTSETKQQDFKDEVQYYERTVKCTEDKHKILWLKKEISFLYDSIWEK